MSPKSSSAVILALIALGAMIYVAVSGDSPPESPEMVTPEPPVSILPDQRTSPSRLLTDAVEGETPPITEEVETEASAGEAPADVAEGRFRLIHGDGRIEDDLDGVAELIVWKEDTGEHRLVPVTGGHFRLELDGGRAIEVGSVTLAGSAAVPIRLHERHATGAGAIVIDVHRPPAITLVVVDTTTQAHLDDVLVVAAPPDLFLPSTNAYPDPGSDPLVTGGRSPIEVAPTTRLAEQKSARLQVGAKGYSWSSVQVDFSKAQEYRVELERGASAEVIVEGAAPPEGAALRLRLGGLERAPDLKRSAAGKRQMILEGLRPVEHTVSIELGDWWDSPRILAQATFVAAPDEQAQVVLTIEDTDLPVPSHLAGTLVLPPYWRERNEALIITRVGQRAFGGARMQLPIAEMERQGDVYSWDAGEVSSGQYEVAIQEPNCRILVEVGPAGVYDARLKVEPPGELSVEIIDETTGLPAEGASLSWRTVDPPSGSQSTNAIKDPDTGRFELIAPMGEVDLHAVGSFTHAPARAPVGQSPSTFTLRVRPTYPLTVILKDGERRVPFPGLSTLDLKHLDGDGKRSGFGMQGGAPVVIVDRPGRYRFEVPKIEGYAPIEPQVIEIIDPKRLVHIIELVRE
ncbi:MAG: hypothetical protein RL885_23120 [Planctomycetota bacterium]